MKIQVRQVGGVAAIDRRLDFERSHVRVTDAGTHVGTRRLDSAEATRLRAAAERLLIKAPAEPMEDVGGASDSMLTEVSIGDANRSTRFRVRSGDDAPAELWDLVDAMSEAAQRR